MSGFIFFLYDIFVHMQQKYDHLRILFFILFSPQFDLYLESNYSHLIQLQNISKTKDHVNEEEGNQPSRNDKHANCEDMEGEVACDFIGKTECFPEEPEEKSFLDEKVAIDDPQPPKKAKLADDGELGSYESKNG